MNDVLACGKPYRWDSVSPNASEGSFEVKAEFSLDDDLFGMDKSSTEMTFTSKPKTVPTASTDAAAASLQTAFCRKPNKNADAYIHPRDGNVKTEMNDNSFSGFGQTQFVQETLLATTTQEPSNNPLCQNGNNCDAQQMDIYRDLILRHLIQDISTTCAKLGLPTDPYNWTSEHGSRWIHEMCQQFSLSLPVQPYLTGRVLLGMNQKEFEALAPEGGETLHAQLQLWKTAFESYHPQQCSGGGMTAADNSVPRHSWMNNQSITETAKGNTRTDFNHQFSGSGEVNNMNYYNNPNFASSGADNSFFGGDITMLSPSNSDMSSNASMHDINEEECIELQLNMLRQGQFGGQPMMNPMGMTPPPSSERPSPFPRHSGTVHLWHFIRELLDHPKQYGSCVRWVDREEGTFKIESSHHLARFWGQRKNRAQMNYDKLSRSLRQYYKKGIIQKPEKKQRLVYKFLPPYNL